jgi:hypothetical protein
LVCVHPTLPPTRRLGQFLPEPDDQDHAGARDQPRQYQPIGYRQRSPALYPTQRVVPVPFRFVIEATRTIVGHLTAPEQVASPAATTLARRRQSPHQRSIKQSGVFEPVGLGPHFLLVADLVHRDAGIPARLPFCTMRPFSFSRGPAEAGTHELLAGIAGHAARLRVAVLHSLLLRAELGARWRCQRDQHRSDDKTTFHLLLSRNQSRKPILDRRSHPARPEFPCRVPTCG